MEKGKDTLKQVAPWKSGVAWWLVLVEGIVALVLGAYLIIAPAQAATILGLLLSLFLIIDGIIQFVASLRQAVRGRLGRWRGIIGVVVGVAILVIWFFGLEARELAVTILGVGLLIYGLTGVFLVLFRRGDTRFRWGVLLGSVILTVVGLVALFDNFSPGFQSLPVIGALLVVLGVGLIIFAVGRRSLADAQPPDESP